MQLSTMKPKMVNITNSLTCVSEQDGNRRGGISQKKWLMQFDQQKHKHNATVVCIKAYTIPTM